MTGDTRPSSGRAILECVGVCLVLIDESSPVNSREWWDAPLAPSERGEALSAGTAANDIFLWSPVLDGTFRIDFSFGKVPFEIHRDMSVQRFELSLPTGGLVARSAVMGVDVMRVDPGKYHGTLIWDHAQESAHSVLSSVDSYPVNEGPDGWVFFDERV